MTELDEKGLERATNAMQRNHMLNWRRQVDDLIDAVNEAGL